MGGVHHIHLPICISPGWPGSFVMDPLDPDYLGLLEREARRHVALLGDDFAGACRATAAGRS